MFDAIAGRYDLLNHLLSGGIDRRWRRQAIRSLALTGADCLLDVCTGTADLAIEAASSTRVSRVVGVDFAAAMLGVGRVKLVGRRLTPRVSLVRGDATRVPLRDASMHAATIAFGIRNVEDPSAACAEIHRVLRPEGRLAILEFGVPTRPVLRTAYLWYFRHVLPRIGRVVSSHGSAYGYLPASVAAFPPPAEFVELLREAGFTDVRASPLTFGVVYLYTGKKRQS
jgi:demethylmenaquinone methyltransferase/2-methoxy-6-polyprenyl-1,4-benzoquinol methylase